MRFSISRRKEPNAEGIWESAFFRRRGGDLNSRGLSTTAWLAAASRRLQRRALPSKATPAPAPQQVIPVLGVFFVAYRTRRLRHPTRDHRIRRYKDSPRAHGDEARNARAISTRSRPVGWL